MDNVLILKSGYIQIFIDTGSPRYMRSFYLRFRVYAIQKWPLFWNLSSDLQLSLVFLYASLFLESLSLEYNEFYLYIKMLLKDFPLQQYPK